jgi:hypothetical protein
MYAVFGTIIASIITSFMIYGCGLIGVSSVKKIY